MTKSREEMLAEAADELFDSGDNGDGKSCHYGFLKGAKWADSSVHPDVANLIHDLKGALIYYSAIDPDEAIEKWKARGK